MRIDSLSVPKEIPNQPVEGPDVNRSRPSTDGQFMAAADDPAGAAATAISTRRIENDLHTLNIKARIGAAGASTVPGAPVVLSSTTDAAGMTPGASGAPAPDGNTGAKNAHPNAANPGAQQQPTATQTAPQPPAKQTVNEQIRDV